MSNTDIETYRDLDAWKVAMELCVLSYELAKQLPVSERFGLSAQIRRAVVSIPANVAEGQCYGKDGRYLAHVRIALGSLGELETHFEIAKRLRYVSASDLLPIERQAARSGQLLHGLRRSLMRKRLKKIGGSLALLIALVFIRSFLTTLG